MVRETDASTDGSEEAMDGGDGLVDRSRRRLLKTAGAGTGFAAVGGATALVIGREHQDDAPAQDANETATPDGDTPSSADERLLDDLIDPTWGYPLGADETDAVDLEHVVQLRVLQDGGVHDGFPEPPGGAAEDAPDEFPVEFAFDPVGIHVHPDDVVHYLSTAGEHTVTAFHDKFAMRERSVPTRIPDHVPGFTSPPLTAGESWVYQYTESGVYDVLCLPHYPFGMVARVVVFDPETDDLEAETFDTAVTGEVPPNVERVLTADELDPANIVDQGEVAWADLTL